MNSKCPNCNMKTLEKRKGDLGDYYNCTYCNAYGKTINQIKGITRDRIIISEEKNSVTIGIEDFNSARNAKISGKKLIWNIKKDLCINVPYNLIPTLIEKLKEIT